MAHKYAILLAAIEYTSTSSAQKLARKPFILAVSRYLFFSYKLYRPKKNKATTSFKMAHSKKLDPGTYKYGLFK